MQTKEKDAANIPWEMVKELLEHLEHTQFWGKVELLFQGKLVRINQTQPMKRDELRKFLNREKIIDEKE